MSFFPGKITALVAIILVGSLAAVSCTRNLSVPITATDTTPANTNTPSTNATQVAMMTQTAEGTATQVAIITQTAVGTSTENEVITQTAVGTATENANMTATQVEVITQTAVGTATQNANMTATENVNMTATENANLTETPGSTPQVFYTNGVLVMALGANCSGVCEGNGGGDGNPDALSITATPGYGTDTQSMQFQWNSGTLILGGYSFASFSAPATLNLTGCTTMQVWAEANQSPNIAVAFDGAGPTGDTNGAPTETLTQSWQQFSVNIAMGSRADGWSTGNLSNLAYYFSIAAAAVPASPPLIVNVDDITFQ